MQVKLEAPRTRGEEEYAAGDVYECSDAEGAALLEQGLASKLGATKPQTVEAEVVVEAAAVKTPETTTKRKATKR